MANYFSWRRLWAVISKEFIHMRRDRLTFGMMVGIPLMQLILFGYAINTNPRHLPTAVVAANHSVYTRNIIRGLKNTDYFSIVHQTTSMAAAERLLAEGKVLFVVNIPPNFTDRLIRGQRPQLLVTADATDPVATGSALSAVPIMMQTVLNPLLEGNLTFLRNKPPTVDLVLHAKYNPEAITAFNIVPALIGVVLTMTMIMITSMALVRERERGSMESLLATPLRPLEVMIGKIVPYIAVGYVQFFLILIAASILFHVPFVGSLILLAILTLPFIVANLAMGLVFSSMADTQLQSMQMAFFFFLPSILLSGFIFPFKGMPVWAQYIGQMLPLTHFLKIVRGILLKGNPLSYLTSDIWPILLFMVVMVIVGVMRYRQTLD